MQTTRSQPAKGMSVKCREGSSPQRVRSLLRGPRSRAADAGRGPAEQGPLRQPQGRGRPGAGAEPGRGTFTTVPSKTCPKRRSLWIRAHSASVTTNRSSHLRPGCDWLGLNVNRSSVRSRYSPQRHGTAATSREHPRARCLPTAAETHRQTLLLNVNKAKRASAWSSSAPLAPRRALRQGCFLPRGGYGFRRAACLYVRLAVGPYTASGPAAASRPAIRSRSANFLPAGQRRQRRRRGPRRNHRRHRWGRGRAGNRELRGRAGLLARGPRPVQVGPGPRQGLRPLLRQPYGGRTDQALQGLHPKTREFSVNEQRPWVRVFWREFAAQLTGGAAVTVSRRTPIRLGSPNRRCQLMSVVGVRRYEAQCMAAGAGRLRGTLVVTVTVTTRG